MKLRFLLIIFSVLTFSIACRTSPEDEQSSKKQEVEFVLPDPNEKFVGSEACSECHINIYNKWKESLHAVFMRKAEDAPGVMADSDFNGMDDFKQGIALGDTTNVPRNDIGFTTYWYNRINPRLSYDSQKGYSVTINDTTFTVSYTLGGNGYWKQLFLTKINNLLFMLPIQYNEKSNIWSFYDSSSWYTGATPHQPEKDSSWEKRCSGCHVTGAVFAGKGSGGVYTTVYKELNIGCEACHGSGKKHVSSKGQEGTIINPSKLISSRANDICFRCHSKGKSKPGGTFSFPWNDSDNISFEPGDNLNDFFILENSNTWGDYSRSSKDNHAQGIEFKKSGHYKSGYTCFTCHDPHNGQYAHNLKENADDNSSCLVIDCHSNDLESQGGLSGITSFGDISGHTKHLVNEIYKSQPNSDRGSKCISCHMPLTAKSSVAGDISNHSMNILYPAESNLLNNGRPNSCMSRDCHSVKDGSMNKWSYMKNDDNNSATVSITSLWNNIRPIANAGNDISVIMDSTVMLNAEKSFDPNDSTNPYNDGITYNWIQTEGPAILPLNDSLTSTPSFKADLPGEYVFKLTVSDGSLGSKPSFIKVKVSK